MPSPSNPNRQTAPIAQGDFGRPSVVNPVRLTPESRPGQVASNTTAGASNVPAIPGQGDNSRNQTIEQDIYRSHTPYSFVIIGGQVAQVKNFDITKTDRPAEPSDARIDISLDAIDSSVFANFMNKGDLVPVEIWCGYLTDSATQEDQESQIQDLKVSILKTGGSRILDEQGREVFVVKKQRKFAQRFSGYVSRPEWQVGNQGEMINLNCRDWLGYLQEFKFYDDFKDSACTVTNIINRFNKDIKGLQFSIEPEDRGTFSMADPDAQDGKRSYSAKGKSYQAVLSEICDRLGLHVFQSGTKVILRYRVRSPFIWKYYHGVNSGTNPSGTPIGTPFDNVRISFGQFGQVETSRDFIVKILGSVKAGSGKKAAARKMEVKFPDNQQAVAGTKIVTRNYPYGATDDKEKLKIYAEAVYRELAARKVTMSLTLGFGNPFLDLYDAVEFVGDGSSTSLDFVKSKWFEVTSISESYNESGYSQTVEGRNNVAYENAFQVIPMIPPRTTNSNPVQNPQGLSANIQPPPN